MIMVRDSKKTALYRAERLALLPMECRFQSQAEIKRFLLRVIMCKWFEKQFPNATALFWRINFESRLRSTALGGGGVVHLPSRGCWAWTDRVILHEIAHSCAPRAGHGPAFCRAYLALVGRFMDGAATDRTAAGRREWRQRCAWRLRAEYGRNNVDMIDHRKVKLAAERMRIRLVGIDKTGLNECAAPMKWISPTTCTAMRAQALALPESGLINVDVNRRHRCAECGEWIEREEPFVRFKYSYNGNGGKRTVTIHSRWCRGSNLECDVDINDLDGMFPSFRLGDEK